MRVKLITDASVEPVTYSEMEYHMHLSTVSGVLSDETTYIEGLITTARKYVEDISGEKLITQVWEIYFDDFPAEGYFSLPFGNLTSVSGVYYTDSDESETEFSSDNYLVDMDSTIGRVILGYNKTYPTVTLSPKNPIRIKFDCGYGSTALNVPEPIKHAIKLLVADMYEGREDTFISAGISKQVLGVVDRLLAPYRIWFGAF